MALFLKLSLFLALKGDSKKITIIFANGFKSLKERHWKLSQYWKNDNLKKIGYLPNIYSHFDGSNDIFAGCKWVKLRICDLNVRGSL